MESSFSKWGLPFPSTHWSQVAIAGRDADEASRAALNEPFGKYWRPVYAFVRHLGRSPHDAEDLTQAYFSRLLERDWLRSADRGRGRFRAFLIQDLKYFLGDESDKRLAEKRGGRVTILSLDVQWADRPRCRALRAGPRGRRRDAARVRGGGRAREAERRW